MKLNKRLSKIASLLSEDAILVDIGCDHGWLDIYLVNNNLIKKAYASDVAQGPLNNVIENVKEYQLEDKIECILSDGLKSFKKIKFTDIVVAGMGGSLIVDILAEYPKIIKDKTIILQPNINALKVRKFLLNNNFIITNEIIIEDNQIIYEIIKAQPGISEEYTQLELLFGKHNLIERKQLLMKYMKQRYTKNEALLQQIPSTSPKFNTITLENKMMDDYFNEC